MKSLIKRAADLIWIFCVVLSRTILFENDRPEVRTYLLIS